MKNLSTLLYVLLLVFVQFSPLRAQENFSFDSVTFLHVNSAITPATFEYLDHSFKKAPAKSLIVIKMNTPGGLVSTTKEIMGLIGKDKRTIAVWVTPEGASAASAGAIIASSAKYIFMSPGTTIGAATPVGLSGDISEQDGKKKVLNDLTALVRSFNQINQRNNKPFEDMILKASSFTEKEALQEKIINGIASSDQDILKYFRSENHRTQSFELSWGQSILSVLSHPTTAYILFLAGLALIYFEFQAPGGYIAGSLGAGMLLLAAMAFQVLPLDWGYFGLLVLGAILLIAEVYITSYGILGILGLLSFLLGSLFLFDGELGFISIQHSVLISSFLGIALSTGVLTWYVLRENKRMIKSDVFSLIGMEGSILKKNSLDHYQVKVRGEIWNATSAEDLQEDQTIVVEKYDQEKLILTIKSQRSL